MKKQIILSIEQNDHEFMILSNQNGDTYTTRSEELKDFMSVSLEESENKEPIENALYATGRFLTTQASNLAEDIVDYLKDAGYSIIKNIKSDRPE